MCDAMQCLCQPSTMTCPSHAVGHQTSYNVVLPCRHHVREVHQDETSQVELFLNSVPILASLTREEKMMLVDALEEQAYAPASRVINQVNLAPSHALHTYLFHTTLMGFSEHAHGLHLDVAVVCLHRLAHTLYLRQALTHRHTLYHMFILTGGKLCGSPTVQLSPSADFRASSCGAQPNR